MPKCNGWTNWETWVTVTFLEDLDGFAADEIQEIVEEILGEHDGLLGDIVTAHIQEVDFEEIAAAFKDDEPQDPPGYEERVRY